MSWRGVLDSRSLSSVSDPKFAFLDELSPLGLRFASDEEWRALGPLTDAGGACKMAKMKNNSCCCLETNDQNVL